MVAAILSKLELCDHCHLSGEKRKKTKCNATGNPALELNKNAMLMPLSGQALPSPVFEHFSSLLVFSSLQCIGSNRIRGIFCYKFHAKVY